MIHHSRRLHKKTGQNVFGIFNNLAIIIPILLTLFGIFMIYESSSVASARLYDNAFYFVKNQIVWFGIALVIFTVFYSINYHLLYQLAIFMLLGNLVLLILIFIPGLSDTVLGAKRRLQIAGIGIQPSEFTKMTLIVYLSAWFSFKERGRFGAFLMLTGVIIGLVMLQPDMGTASILAAIAVFLYFASGAPLRHFAMILPVMAAAGLLLAVMSPYRMQRIMTYINPGHDTQGVSYHVEQINIALNIGGLFGTGFGSSRQKFQFLPEAHTDSIFAIIGENFGFIGTSIVVGAYAVFLLHCYKRLSGIRDRLGFLLASGIIFLVMLQAVLNLMAMVQLVPLTGVPLPFISYGGSSLLTFYALLGILLNIFKQNKT